MAGQIYSLVLLLVAEVDEEKNMKSVIDYFQEVFATCKIVEGQRYSKRLNDKQITSLLKFSCQRLQEQEAEILQEQKPKQFTKVDTTEEDPYAKEFGISIDDKLASVEARVLPAPWEFNFEPGIPIHAARPDQVKKALKYVCIAAANGREEYCTIGRLALENSLSDIPTIIFGADVTHPESGEDLCAQPQHQELIQDLYNTWQNPKGGTVTGGMIRYMFTTPNSFDSGSS
ncbi:hypothetical protein RHSIM_Rhsim03G0269000 [Rhododendron simsii]|uniref:Argonaute linker 2 domain-containing protein n=1 Tax=Rhododendron simsii TaxID=118357 RepID=A0A834LV50_RHOSS|nr:hypothetical protein RHSIM_Rhsim03G0269000 [Rhododendron simsii]